MSIKRSLITLVISALAGSFFFAQPASAVTGADWRPGRIIDDAVFYNNTSMNVDQIQHFLNSKVPVCDNWGTRPYAGTTRRAYSEARGVKFPLTCLKDYHENTATKENNLEGRPIPPGAKSAARIIWEAAQEFRINPQVLIVTLQKEQSLVTDDWPWPHTQFRSAMGYGCPDTALCDSRYYGFYNQVYNAARQFRLYANNPRGYNHIPNQNNFVRYNPNAACGGSTVFIENQATASLYNYTPYQPNASALANLYGTGDGCAAHGNRNFWRTFNDWFGSTQFHDPFGWDIIKLPNDDRWFLVVGATKRWIPSGNIFDDWNLGSKPVRTVSQAEFDSLATLPPLDRLGEFFGRYYYVDGGKRYWLSTDELLRAWGQFDKKILAVPAYTVLASIPDGGEATFYATQPQEQKIAFLAEGKRYTFPGSEIDRWRPNPVTLSSHAYNSIPEAAQLDYHVSIHGLKFVVDRGRLLDVTNYVRDYAKTATTFVPIPSSVIVFMRSESANRVMVAEGSPHWYAMINGYKYHIPRIETLRAWNLPDQPTVVSAKTFDQYVYSSIALAPIVHEPGSGKYYLIDNGSRREFTGVAWDAVQGGKAFPQIDAASIDALPSGAPISSPIVRSRDGHTYSIMNGEAYHIPNHEVLNASGVPRRYGITDISNGSAYSISNSYLRTGMFIKSGGVTYFMQDGHAFPVDGNALADWTRNNAVVDYSSPNFTSRFNVHTQPVSQKINQIGERLVISNGLAINVSAFGDAFAGADSWQGLVTFGMPVSKQNTFLVRSSNPSDPRLWLINNGSKTYLNSIDQLLAYSSGGQRPALSLSPAVLNTFADAAAGPSLLTVSPVSGFKLLEQDGSFYSFPNGDTAVNFMSGNRIENLSPSIAQSFDRERKPITRLIREPNGKVYWVENGKKRWIKSDSGLRTYSATPITDVSAAVAAWLPNGADIN